MFPGQHRSRFTATRRERDRRGHRLVRHRLSPRRDEAQAPDAQALRRLLQAGREEPAAAQGHTDQRFHRVDLRLERWGRRSILSDVSSSIMFRAIFMTGKT